MRYLLVAFFVAVTASAEESPAPKYDSGTLRLSREHEFIRCCPAPDFWALMPGYAAQPDDQSCSAASMAMLVNALRSGRDLAADEPLATPESVVDAVPAPRWRDKLQPGGPGVTLQELSALIPCVLEAFGESNAGTKVVHFPDAGPESLSRLVGLLANNERSARDIILVNVLQSELTGDPEGNVGHIAPVGAYDAARGRVFVLDPDRRWYEPYWVSMQTLLEGMATRDSGSGDSRGLVIVTKGRRN